MRKYYNIFMMLVVALVGLSLTACSSDDDLNTDQYGNGISLSAFGPCPVLRGGTLYFLGTNLDQISEIDLPGADPITQFEVIEAGGHSKISIKVPAEKCDTGVVVLKTAKGGIIKSVSPITYREDIKFDKFFVGQEGNLVGSVGDVVTIKGDYLNLMHAVIFADKDTVKEDQFIKHDRYTIEVAIPAEAKSGKFKLSDMAETPSEIETEQALDINLPEIKAITPETAKAGAIMTVTGSSFDQIASIEMNGASIEAKDFKSQNATTITFALPETATDGVVTLITKSGVKISTKEITTVVPTDLKAAPDPVKNGNTLTITGKDLDLVSNITFPNATAVGPKSKNASTITVDVPELAQEGNITLTLANGKTVTVAYKLVKPAVTAFTPAELVAGAKVMMKGTDLDLVASVEFPGEASVAANAADTKITATAIGTTVPAVAYGSGCTLVLKNGTKVEVKGLTINPATDPAITTATVSGSPAKDVTVAGKNFNNVEAIYIGTTKITKIRKRNDTSVTFLVPETIALGKYDFFMVTLEGKKVKVGTFEAVPAEIDVATIVKKMDGSDITYPFDFTWDDKGRYQINLADLTSRGIKAGSTLFFYKEKSKTGQVQLNDGWWASFETVADWNGTEEVLSYKLTDANWAKITETGGIVIQGDLKGVTKITILP